MFKCPCLSRLLYDNTNLPLITLCLHPLLIPYIPKVDSVGGFHLLPFSFCLDCKFFKMLNSVVVPLLTCHSIAFVLLCGL
jgi:hypothetical protein